jgi:hypothetical protein
MLPVFRFPFSVKALDFRFLLSGGPYWMTARLLSALAREYAEFLTENRK